MTFLELIERTDVAQKALANLRLQRPELRAARDTAKLTRKATYKRQWLIIKTGDPNMTKAELTVMTDGDEEVLKAWAEEIVATSKVERLDMEIENAEDEIKNMEVAGNNLKRERDTI